MAFWGIHVALVSCGGSNHQSAAVITEPAHVSSGSHGRGGGPASPTSADARQAIEKAYRANRGVKEGKNADYIPVLAKVDSALFGIALATPDGQVIEVGDARHPFSIQSVVKVFTLARVLEDVGPERVEKTVGLDATGQPFNSLLAIAVNEKHRAGNPLVNAGAITTVGLLTAKSANERWARVINNLNAFAGRNLVVDEDVYRSETASNQGNRGIAWMLKNYKVITGEPDEILDVYTRECSVSVNARDLAVMGATLANGGTNPVTGSHVLSTDNAARVLAQMMTNGLYETSGTWSFKAGLPAKSGVGGGIVAVVPGRFAVGTFSPPLDEAGNSVRGQRAIESIVKDLDANIFKVEPGKAPVATASTTAPTSAQSRP
jgi:glutaminase